MALLSVVFNAGIAFLMVWSGVMAQDDPVVKVKQGTLRGEKVTSVLGKPLFRFVGIPYAQPPLGDLRFKVAKPPKAWNGTLDATQQGSACTQYNKSASKVIGSEDCLYLNVFTPSLPEKGIAPLPVMVYFPGGGFVSDSADENKYGADYLVSKYIVLVTVNYRLNCFGFIYLKKAASTNVGLKDQVAALRWVKENIKIFNGDPNKVTIFGQSAGGVSVTWHMMSPISKGLFHGAIAQSGASMMPWAIQREPYETSMRLARAVGCTGGSERDVVKCLRKVEYDKLCKAATFNADSEENKRRFILFTFVPTLEEQLECGEKRFVMGPPEQLLKRRCVHDVPFLTGYNGDEWMLVAGVNNSTMFESDESLNQLDTEENWRALVLNETRLPDDLSSSKEAEATKDLKNFYLRGEPLSTKNVRGYKNMLTDMLFGYDILYGINDMSESKKSPSYLYSFTVDEKLNRKQEFGLEFPGASHTDELGYLFRVKTLPNVSSDDAAFKTRERMVQMWTDFAKFGNPTPNKTELIEVEWTPYTTEKPNYFHIGNDLSTGFDLFAKRSGFWDDFYKKNGVQRDGGAWWKICPFNTLLYDASRISSILG